MTGAQNLSGPMTISWAGAQEPQPGGTTLGWCEGWDLPLLVLGVLTGYHFSTSCLPVTVATGMLTKPT